jgi:hypothetical protein
MSQSIDVNGVIVTRLQMQTQRVGVWSAIVNLDQAADVIGSAVINIGGAEYHGAFVSELSGTHNDRTDAVIVGGTGGWRQNVAAQHYHSDSFVKARTVVQDLINASGESAGSVDIDVDLGIDYVREFGTAGRAMRAACGDVPWWVDTAGLTHVGERTSAEVVGAYDVLDIDPRWKIATVVAEDVSVIGIGSVLRRNLDRPLLVKSISIRSTEESLRLTCWGQEVSS